MFCAIGYKYEDMSFTQGWSALRSQDAYGLHVSMATCDCLFQLDG